MMRWIDGLLNRVTMYRLTLYILLALLGAALVLSMVRLLPFSPVALAASVALIMAVCILVNELFSRVFKIPTNVESVYITTLILVFILTPPSSRGYLSFFEVAVWASVLAMASKYIIAIRNKHIFNPAAFAVALTAVTIGQSASWWIGTAWMAIPVSIGGFLIIRKTRRTDLVVAFLAVSLIVIIGAGLARGEWRNYDIEKGRF